MGIEFLSLELSSNLGAVLGKEASSIYFQGSDFTTTQELDFITQSGAIKEYVESHTKIFQCAPSNFDGKAAMIRYLFMMNIAINMHADGYCQCGL